tara:strand:- start:674 stop:1126 length:453 start_codon:yes stop_codon:yes gene_type:complete
MNENYYIELALEQAKKGFKNDEVPVGAVLVDNISNKIIASSYNQTHSKKNPLKHAEIIVIEMGCIYKKSRYLYDTSIFITLEPCVMCSAAISEARIKKIYFGAYDQMKGAVDSIIKIYNNKRFFVPEIYGGIEEEKCTKILKEFFKKKRK